MKTGDIAAAAVLSDHSGTPALGSYALLSICALVYFLDGLVHTIMGPLAPELTRTLGLGHAEMGPVFSANLLGQCLGLLAFPLLANRYGHRMVVAAALFGFGLAQAMTGFAGTVWQLFSCRLVTGIFLGGCLPSCLAMVTANAAPARRGTAISILFTGYGLGGAVAGFVASLFLNLGGWRVAMVAVGLACIIVSIIALFGLRKASGDGPIAEGPDSDVASFWSVLTPRYLAGTLALWLLFICMLTISYCLNSWLPILLVEVGHDGNFAAMSVSIFSLGGILAGACVGVLIDRFGAFFVLISYLLISSALLLLLGQMLAEGSATQLVVLLAVSGFFVLGAYAGVNVVLANFYPHALRAIGIGWTKSVGRIGTVVAPILIGLGLGAGMKETLIMSLFAVPAALSVMALVVLAVEKRHRKVRSP